MKNILNILLIASILFISSVSWADSPQVFTLKDGSQIKGKLIDIDDGIYIIESPALGEVEIEESEVLNISKQNEGPKDASNLLSDHSGMIEQEILSDPALMENVQNIMADPEFMNMMMNPEMLNNLLSGNPEALMNNPNMQLLLDNPSMQELINDPKIKEMSDELLKESE